MNDYGGVVYPVAGRFSRVRCRAIGQSQLAVKAQSTLTGIFVPVSLGVVSVPDALLAKVSIVNNGALSPVCIDES